MLPPETSINFAWDQPSLKHTLAVVGSIQDTDGQPVLALPTEYDLDKIKSLGVLRILTGPSKGSGRIIAPVMRRNQTIAPGSAAMSSGPFGVNLATHIVGTAGGNLLRNVTRKDPHAAVARRDTNTYDGTRDGQSSQSAYLARLMATFAKEVSVSVYADGPTRVLCFSDEPFRASPEEEGGLVNLGYRLQQVSRRLRQADKVLSVLMGSRHVSKVGTMRTAGLMTVASTTGAKPQWQGLDYEGAKALKHAPTGEWVGCCACVADCDSRQRCALCCCFESHTARLSIRSCCLPTMLLHSSQCLVPFCSHRICFHFLVPLCSSAICSQFPVPLCSNPTFR